MNGVVNYFVIECDTQEEAEIIKRNADDREEMVDVCIINETKHWPSNVKVSLKHFNELGQIWKKPEEAE